jgi:hypothetical protein
MWNLSSQRFFPVIPFTPMAKFFLAIHFRAPAGVRIEKFSRHILIFSGSRLVASAPSMEFTSSFGFQWGSEDFLLHHLADLSICICS